MTKIDVEKWNPHTLPVEIPQKFKPHYSAIPFLDIFPMKTYVHIKTGTQIFMAALFILAKKQGQPECPSTDQCINKLQYNHIMEYY